MPTEPYTYFLELPADTSTPVRVEAGDVMIVLHEARCNACGSVAQFRDRAQAINAMMRCPRCGKAEDEMAGGERALIRRRSDTGTVEAVLEISPYQRGALAILINGGTYTRDQMKAAGRLRNAVVFDLLLAEMSALGAVRLDGDRVTATALGRYDLLVDGAKGVLLLAHRDGKVRASAVPGSGRHPTSFRALGRLAQKGRIGFWSLTELGRASAEAAVAEGLG